MRYRNGVDARLGDRVRINDVAGVVVVSVDSNEYAPAFPRDDWQDTLGCGLLVDFETWGLMQCIEPDEDLEFVSRGDV